MNLLCSPSLLKNTVHIYFIERRFLKTIKINLKQKIISEAETDFLLPKMFYECKFMKVFISKIIPLLL